MSSLASDGTELLLPMEQNQTRSSSSTRDPPKSFLRKNFATIMTLLLAISLYVTMVALGMGQEKAVCAVTIFGTMTAMAVFNLPSDLSMFVSSVVLLATQTIDRDDFLKGYGNSSVVCVGLLLVVAKGIEETGALERLVKLFLGKPSTRVGAQLAMMGPVILISAFLSNTACVAMMIPILQSWSDSINQSRSQLLLPLSYVSMMGGCLSLIGSSNNLVAYEKAKDWAEANSQTIEIGMFDVAKAGIPMIVAGVIYMCAFSAKLLPSDADPNPASNAAGSSDAALTDHSVDMRYSMCFWVKKTKLGAPNDVYQRTPSEIGFDRPMLTLVARHRDDKDSGDKLGMDERLNEGELLIFKGTAGRLAQLQKMAGLGLATKEIEKLSFARTKEKANSSLSKRRHRRIVEAVVDVNSPLIGKSVKDIAFRQTFNAVIIARRHGISKQDGSMWLQNKARSLTSGFIRTDRDSFTAPTFIRHGGTDYVGNQKRAHGTSVSLEESSNSEKMEAGAKKNVGVSLAAKNCDCNTSWSEVVFCPGDSLLLVASPGFVKQFSATSRYFALATELPDSKPARVNSGKDIGRAMMTWAMLLAIIGVSAWDDTYLLEMCVITISLQIFFQVMTLEEAWGAVKGSTLLTIASSFSLGTAIQNCGLAEDIAKVIGLAAGPFGEIGLLAVVGLVTSVLSIMVSNTAVVIFLFDPVAEAAKTANMDLLPFVFVLMVASSAAYATPISYQTNLMVYAPGGYSFNDYLIFGGPLQIISWITWTVAIYVIFC